MQTLGPTQACQSEALGWGPTNCPKRPSGASGVRECEILSVSGRADKVKAGHEEVLGGGGPGDQGHQAACWEGGSR